MVSTAPQKKESKVVENTALQKRWSALYFLERLAGGLPDPGQLILLVLRERGQRFNDIGSVRSDFSQKPASFNLYAVLLYRQFFNKRGHGLLADLDQSPANLFM